MLSLDLVEEGTDAAAQLELFIKMCDKALEKEEYKKMLHFYHYKKVFDYDTLYAILGKYLQEYGKERKDNHYLVMENLLNTKGPLQEKLRQVDVWYKGQIEIQRQLGNIERADELYKQHVDDMKCPNVPTTAMIFGKGGSHKPNKSSKPKTHPTKTNKRVKCKDGKKRTVYVKAGVEYVKRKNKQGNMRYVKV